MVTATITTQLVRRLLDEVVDPEIPVLTIAELGILRDVEVTDDGSVLVTLTPTYSGCPAMDLVRRQVRSVLEAHGIGSVRVRTVYAPAWTSDWLSEEARRKLASAGIAPPGRAADPGPVVCPRCASEETRVVSEFGSTACKALSVCERCGEPFDRFKEL